jgi:hypothetical protein
MKAKKHATPETPSDFRFQRRLSQRWRIDRFFVIRLGHRHGY